MSNLKSKNSLKYLVIFALCIISVLSLCLISSCKGTRGQGDKIKVEDLTGVNYAFDHPLNKVFCTHSPCQNIVIALGGGEKHIAALLENDRNEFLYRSILDNYDQLPLIGKIDKNTYEKETVVQSDAELVILPERHVNIAAQFEHSGLKTFVVLPNKENRKTITDAVDLLGTILGEEDRAEMINNEVHKLIDKINARFNTIQNKPKVLFMGDDKNTACTNDLVQSQIMEYAGATNAVTGKYKVGKYADIDDNKICEFNPDVIWIPHYAKYSVDDILNNPKLANVPAITSKNVFVFPSHLEPWDVPTPSFCLGVCWAAHNLHPSAYSQKELLEDINDFYKLLYNKTFTAQDLELDGNCVVN